MLINEWKTSKKKIKEYEKSIQMSMVKVECIPAWPVKQKYANEVEKQISTEL